MRVEHTSRKSDYSYEPENGERVVTPERNDFTNFFPGFHVIYNFSDKHNLTASYSQRINRPDYWSLIPLSQYSSPYSYYKGNGALLPAYSDAYEMGYMKSWDNDFITFEAFARRTRNVIQSFSRTDTINILVSTPENVGDSWSIGTELMAGVDIFSWWNANISTSLYSYQLYIYIDEINKTEYQFRTDSRLNNTFLLPKSFTLKLDFRYNSPYISAQERRDGYFYSNIALKKGIKDNMWMVTLACSNIFNSRKYTKISAGAGFFTEKDIIIEPYASLRISYSFDNQK